MVILDDAKRRYIWRLCIMGGVPEVMVIRKCPRAADERDLYMQENTSRPTTKEECQFEVPLTIDRSYSRDTERYGVRAFWMVAHGWIGSSLNADGFFSRQNSAIERKCDN